jgi:glycosyltransferase involved in cell wall biosynthesis
MPVHDPPARLLSAAIESVLAQTYPHWELCTTDDASSKPWVREILEQYAAADPRIKVIYREKSGHIATASNDALARATGEFIVPLDHDDLLARDALLELARVVDTCPTVDFLYSDEDKLEPNGTRVEPFFKPAWSPTLLTSCNYITHLAALRRSLVLDVGGFRSETVGSQDHDLFLRIAERAQAVAHIPLVLYSWRKSRASAASSSTAKPYAI